MGKERHADNQSNTINAMKKNTCIFGIKDAIRTQKKND